MSSSADAQLPGALSVLDFFCFFARPPRWVVRDRRLSGRARWSRHVEMRSSVYLNSLGQHFSLVQAGVHQTGLFLFEQRGLTVRVSTGVLLKDSQVGADLYHGVLAKRVLARGLDRCQTYQLLLAENAD